MPNISCVVAKPLLEMLCQNARRFEKPGVATFLSGRASCRGLREDVLHWSSSGACAVKLM
jgi:hypothetical protein